MTLAGISKLLADALEACDHHAREGGNLSKGEALEKLRALYAYSASRGFAATARGAIMAFEQEHAPGNAGDQR